MRSAQARLKIGSPRYATPLRQERGGCFCSLFLLFLVLARWKIQSLHASETGSSKINWDQFWIESGGNSVFSLTSVFRIIFLIISHHHNNFFTLSLLHFLFWIILFQQVLYQERHPHKIYSNLSLTSEILAPAVWPDNSVILLLVYLRVFCLSLAMSRRLIRQYWLLRTRMWCVSLRQSHIVCMYVWCLCVC